jgi:hypothetical protein
LYVSVCHHHRFSERVSFLVFALRLAVVFVRSFGWADFPRNFCFRFLTGRTMSRASFDDFMWHRIWCNWWLQL